MLGGFITTIQICIYEKVYDQVFLIHRGFSNARAFIFVRPPPKQLVSFVQDTAFLGAIVLVSCILIFV